MMKRYIILIAIALIMASCCEKSIVLKDIDTDFPMEFNAEYPVLTRASDSGFENGDCIGIYVGDYKGNVPPTLDGGILRADNLPFTYEESVNKWNGAASLYWKDKNTPVDVVGYYPYTDPIENPTEYLFSIETRQDRSASGSQLGGYQTSDLLWAKCEKALPEDGSINLTFRHLMAGVKVILEKGEGFDDNEWASLNKNVMVNHSATSTSVNLETGVVGSQISGDESVFAYHYANTFRAVIIPKSYDAGTEILTISVGDQNYKLKYDQIVNFKSGKMHTFTVKVDKRNSSGDYSFSLIGEGISQWIDDNDFHDGIVRNYITVNVESPGTFSQILEQQRLDYSLVRSLKVTGRVNANDLTFMGDMPVLQNLNLKEIIIDNSGVKGQNDDCINDDAFSDALISHLILPDKLKIIGPFAFSGVPITGTLIFPEGLEEIKQGAFFSSYESNNGGFKVVFPSTLKKIGDWAFGGNGTSCCVRGELNFPEGLVEIGANAFWNGNNISGTLELPESLTSIGECAFERCKFTGNLVIPSGIKVIPGSCFSECAFDGNLILKEGLINIKECAFFDCKFRGELAIPTSVREIGLAAFESNHFSSVSLPEKLVLLGQKAFMNCEFLSGEIRIPSSIVSVPAFCFKNCSLITGIVLHKDISSIEAEAFMNDNFINTIICENPNPPYLDAYAFSNVVKSQINVEVPKEGLNFYKQNKTWKEFTRISEYRNFVCRPAMANALSNSREQKLVLNADGDWKVTHKPDWVTLSQTHGSLKSEIIATFANMPSNISFRDDYIVFQLEGTDVETSCYLSQYGYEYQEDQIVQLQKHKKGNGISIYFVGDGWDASSIASGSYIDLCRSNMEHFFGLPPYDRLRDYFDVYACVALSQETGVTTMNVSRDTKFQTIYPSGIGYTPALIPNDEAIFSYLSNLTGMQTANRLCEGDMWKSLIILIPNTTEYSGITYYYNDGSTISVCPPSDRIYPNDTRGTIQHEAGGHGFGKLADESITKNQYILSCNKSEIENYQNIGWYINISTNGVSKNVSWSDMIFDSRYSSYVDIFEGGYGYTRGVWRPEENSCMNNAIPYYNAISRLDITRRVFDLAGVDFNIDRDFYNVDTYEWGSTGSYSTRSSFSFKNPEPIHSHNAPVLMKQGQYKQIFDKIKK